MKCVQFGFDIRKVNGRDVYRNPMWRLWRIGIWISGSQWILPADSTPLTMIEEMNALDCTTHVLPFESSDVDLCNLAAKQAAREIARRQGSADQTEANLYRQLTDLEALNAERAGRGLPPLPAITAARYRTGARAAMTSARRRIRTVARGAAAFGVAADTFEAATLSIAAHLNRVDEQAKKYVEMTKQLAENGDTALAAAAKADELPVGVMLDRLQDRDVDVNGARELFEAEEEFSEGFAPVGS